MRRSLRILIAAVIVVGTFLVSASSALALSITVTAPSGSASYTNGQSIPVAWRTDVTVTSGDFSVWVVGSTQAYCVQVVRSHRSSSLYTTTVTADFPAATGYRVKVGYRARSGGAWGAFAWSPGTFDIVTPPMPFETLTNAPYPDSVVMGQGHAFRFWVFHPDPTAVVTAGQVVFTAAKTRQYVTSVPITGISSYVIETDWTYDGTPAPNVFYWSSCALPVGSYRWYVLVTVDGAQNTMHDDATLTVTRR